MNLEQRLRRIEEKVSRNNKIDESDPRLEGDLSTERVREDFGKAILILEKLGSDLRANVYATKQIRSEVQNALNIVRGESQRYSIILRNLER